MVAHDIPIVGINRGRLGFLTDILPENMRQDLGEVLQGDYYQENRTVFNRQTHPRRRNNWPNVWP